METLRYINIDGNFGKIMQVIKTLHEQLNFAFIKFRVADRVIIYQLL